MSNIINKQQAISQPTPGLVKWVQAKKAAYEALSQKDPNSLYFIVDTGEIYKGAVSFSDSVINMNPNYNSAEPVESFTAPEQPANPIAGKIYIYPCLISTGARSSVVETAMYTYTNGAWITLYEPASNSITPDGTGHVSSKAVVDYVTQQVSGLVKSINYANNTLTYESESGATQNVPISGFVTGASYHEGVLTFEIAGKDSIAINLPKDNFVNQGSYDPETKSIILDLVNGDKVTIPAGDLATVFTVGSTQTVEMNLSPSNEITANVKVSAATKNNLLQAYSDGLGVVIPENTYASNVGKNHANNLITATATGDIQASDVIIGGATLNSSPNAATVATEKAVSSAISPIMGQVAALELEVENIPHNLHGKFMTVLGQNIGGELPLTQADGNLELSGYYVGDATLGTKEPAIKQAHSDATVNGILATESAVSQAVEGAMTNAQNMLKESMDSVEGQISQINTNLAGKMNVLPTNSGATNKVVVNAGNGQVSSSEYSLGGSTLPVSAAANVLATEQAVMAALTWNVLE